MPGDEETKRDQRSDPPKKPDSRRERAEAIEDEDPDEVWSNTPAGAVKPEPEPVADGDDDEEDDEPEPIKPRREIRTARDLFMEEVPMRAKRKASKLRAQLTGQVVTEVTSSGERFLFDWRTEEPKIEEIKTTPALKSAENPTAEQVDCIIRVSEQQLFQIREGNLNPQVAMVNGKIKVEGKAGLAMYFFNVVSDR